jgi:hypothetical protein
LALLDPWKERNIASASSPVGGCPPEGSTLAMEKSYRLSINEPLMFVRVTHLPEKVFVEGGFNSQRSPMSLD